MKTYRKILAAFFAAAFLAVAARAADVSPAGTWKWTQAGRGGNPGTERTLVLEMKGDQVTGTVKGVSMGQFEIPDVAITNASYKDGLLAFTVENEFNGNKFVSKYEGKVDGDTIKGSIERPGRDGNPMKTDWNAKRAAAAK